MSLGIAYTDGIPTGSCQRCKCCSLTREDCDACGGDGFVESEDWQDYGEMFPCGTCAEQGGWSVCVGDCDQDGKHVGRLGEPTTTDTDPR